MQGGAGANRNFISVGYRDSDRKGLFIVEKSEEREEKFPSYYFI